MQTKYKSIRTYYVKLRKQVHASMVSGAGTEELFKPNWPYYEACSFLDDTLMLTHSTESSIDNEQNHQIEKSSDMSPQTIECQSESCLQATTTGLVVDPINQGTEAFSSQAPQDSTSQAALVSTTNIQNCQS